MNPLLSLRSLRVTLQTRRGPVPVLRGIDLDVADGEALGIAGESGSGKSTLASTIIRTLPLGGAISGSMTFRGRDLLAMDPREMRRIRGREIAIVFQEPSFDPLARIGKQIAEVLKAHGMTEGAAARVGELLVLVGLDPDVAISYPHRMSGGMLQRAQLAAALAARPSLLIADEPTSAIDAVLQTQLLDLLSSLRTRLALSVILISHDLSVISRFCQRIAVMYAGQLVEEGSVRDVLSSPLHPYTALLLRASRFEGSGGLGSAPDMFSLPSGCAFRERCPRRLPVCDSQDVDLRREDGRAVRCVHYE